MSPIYLDHNATAPLLPEARAAMLAALDHVGNASSVHGFGRAARRTVEDARASVAALVGAAPRQVVFTAGATEANNAALAQPGGDVLVSAIEHDSVRAAAPGAATVPVTPDGVVDLDALGRLLAAARPPALVAVMLANNEIGTIQPLEAVVAAARRHGARVHCDAVQAAGRLPVDFAALGVDSLSLSAHKLGGPQGAGALVLRDDAGFTPLLVGGGQERRLRAGTENVAAIAGFGAAAAVARDGLAAQQRIGRLRDALEARIRAADPAVVVFGAEAPRIPNTSCIAMAGVPAETQLMGFDLAGIAVSSGAACSSGKVAASHVLAALGADPALAGSAIRVSLGRDTDAAAVDRFVEVWTALRARAARRAAVA